MEYLVLTKPIEKDHYDFAKFFKDEDEVIKFLSDTPHENFQRDIRILSEESCKKTTEFDDEDLLDTYIELTDIAQLNQFANEEVE